MISPTIGYIVTKYNKEDKVSNKFLISRAAIDCQLFDSN